MTFDNFSPRCKFTTQTSISGQANEPSKQSKAWSPRETRIQSEAPFGWTVPAPIRGKGWACRAETSRGWWQWPCAQRPLRAALTNWNVSKEGRLGREACLVRNSWRNWECLPWNGGNAVKGTIVTLKSLMSCGWGEKKRGNCPEDFLFLLELKSPQCRAPGSSLSLIAFTDLGFIFLWSYENICAHKNPISLKIACIT